MRAICVDVDNVIAKTDEIIRQVIKLLSQKHVELQYEDVVCFDYWLCKDKLGQQLGKNEWGKIHDEFTCNYLHRVQLYDNVRVHLEQMANKFEIHLATSRLPKGHQSTITWLEKNKISYNKLHFVDHGQKHLINHEFVAAIEDDREQGYAFYTKGVQVFLMAHPWNNIGPYSSLKRLKNWEEITKEVMKLAV